MFDSLYTTSLPDQSLSPHETELRYGSIKNAYRLAGLYYSRAFNNMGITFDTQSDANTMGTEFNEIVRNFDLFHGRQKTTMFKFMDMVQDESGEGEVALPIQPGQESAAIFLFLQGLFLQVATNAEANAMVMNQEIKNKMTAKLRAVEIKRKFGEYIEAIEKAAGRKFNAPADPTQGQDAIIKAIYQSFSSGLQKDANALWSYIRANSAEFYDMLRAYTNMMIGRRAVVYVQDNGLLKLIQPQFYRNVAAEDDDFGRFDIARMFIERRHREEVAAELRQNNWITPSEYDTFKSASAYSNLLPWQSIYNNYNFNWFSQESDMVTGATIYYRSMADSRYVKVDTEDGNKQLKRLSSKTKTRGELVPVIRRVTIWGAYYTSNYGIYDTIDDPNKFGNKLFPIMHFAPNTYKGINVSMADRVMSKQQEIDALQNRINEFTSQDIGKLLEFDGRAYDNGITPSKFYGMARKFKIVVKKGSPEAADPVNRMPSVNAVDASLMRDIQEYISVVNNRKAELKEILNVNNVTMGTPGSYVGFKTQQNSAALASNSVQYGIIGTIQLFADAGTFALEKMRKRVIEDPENPVFQNLLGEDGVKRILDNKDVPYSRWLLRLSFKDIIDPARRERLNTFLTQLAATGAVDWRDVLTFEDAKTISEVIDKANYAAEKKEYKANLQAMSQAETKLAAAQTIADANMEKTAMEVEGGIAEQQMASRTKLADTTLKTTGDPNAAAAVLQQ